MGDDRGVAHSSAWSRSEQVSYFVSSRLVTIPGEEAVVKFLEHALVGTPLPIHWTMRRDPQHRPFFWNSSTGMSSWSHPLESTLREVAGICRMCLTLPMDCIDDCVAKLQRTCEEDNARELQEWYAMAADDGKVYYCNRVTEK